MLKSHLFHIECFATQIMPIYRSRCNELSIDLKFDDDVELVYHTNEIHDMMNKDYTLYKNAVKHFSQILNIPPNRIEVTKIYKIHNHLIVN